MVLFPDTTAAILMGGASRRMGRDKAGLKLDGVTLVDRIHRCLVPLVAEVLLVTKADKRARAEALAPAGARVVVDLSDVAGPLAGLHAALVQAASARVLVVAVDMPDLEPRLLRALLADDSADVVIPRTAHGLEPLLAVYRTTCRPAIERQLARGPGPVSGFFPAVTVTEWPETRLREFDPELDSFRNVNRPADLASSRPTSPNP